VNKNLKRYLFGKFSLKRLMTSLLLISLFVYLGLLIYAYFYAETLIFQPFSSSYLDDAKIIKLTTSDGEKISAKFHENPNATHTILFSHGNAEDIGELDSLFEAFLRNKFAVLAYDYRGYGTSDGKPSEEKVYRDIDAAYDYLINELKIPPEKIIVYGRSLGGAVSIDLAARKEVGGLIAESSFVSAFRVLTKIRITPFDKFESLKKIKKVKCPVLFIHGRKDSIVAFWHGEKLFAEANEPKFSYWIDEANHNNVHSVGGAIYSQKIRDFANNVK
jgi:abhydrolase domain-containing protein 17